MKKCLILIASSILSCAAQAEYCTSALLVLSPSAETQIACKKLRLVGPGTVKACRLEANESITHAIELAMETGGIFDLESGFYTWTSKSEYSDEESGKTVTSILNLSLLSNTYSGQEITTDRRGHRTVVDCSGALNTTEALP